MKKNNTFRKILIIFFILMVAHFTYGCFGGAAGVKETARPAMQEQYAEYLANHTTKSRVDKDWKETANAYKRFGWEVPLHPYGDKSLKSMGLKKIRNHEFSHQ